MYVVLRIMRGVFILHIQLRRLDRAIQDKCTWRLTKAQHFLRWATVATIVMGRKKLGGLLCPFRGELGPRLIQCCLAEIYFPTKWRLHPSSRLVTIDMSRKLGGSATFRGLLRPHLTQRRWAEVYLPTKWHLDPSSRLFTIDMGQKLGGVGVPFFLGRAESPSNTKSPGTRPTSTQPFGHNGHWSKIGGYALWGRRAGSPSNTSVPTGILIHAAVCHNRRGPKIGGSTSFWGGELGPHLTQSRLGWGLPPYEVASWCIQPFGHNNKNSSGDEIANVNFVRQHRTCRGQRLRPFNELVISTKRLRQNKNVIRYLPVLKWTRPSNPLRTTNGRAHR